MDNFKAFSLEEYKSLKRGRDRADKINRNQRRFVEVAPEPALASSQRAELPSAYAPSSVKHASQNVLARDVEFTEWSVEERSGFGVNALNPRDRASRIIAEARETAQMMMEQARAAIATEREAALEKARNEGYEQGLSLAEEEMAGLLKTCETIGLEVSAERDRILEANEQDLVELALAIAKKIVNASIDVDPSLVIDVCKGAMRKAFQRGDLQVLAHPADLEALKAAGPRISEELGGIEHLEFIEERRLDRGSIIVRTPAGEIDATIDGKSAKIEQALREGIESRRAAAREK